MMAHEGGIVEGLGSHDWGTPASSDEIALHGKVAIRDQESLEEDRCGGHQLARVMIVGLVASLRVKVMALVPRLPELWRAVREIRRRLSATARKGKKGVKGHARRQRNL